MQNEWRRVSCHRAQKQQRHLMEDRTWQSWEWSAQWQNSGGKVNSLPAGFIPLLRNQSRNVETILLIWVITEGRSPEYRRSRTLKILCACVSVQRYFRRAAPASAPPPLSWRGVQTSVQSARTSRPEQLLYISPTFSAHSAPYLACTTRLLWQVWLQVPVRTHVLRCYAVPVCILIAIWRDFRLPSRCERNPRSSGSLHSVEQ